MTCTPPWMVNINCNAWNGVQTAYPRTVDVHRTKTTAGPSDAIGAEGYSGAEGGTVSPEGEDVLFTNRIASIQVVSAGRTTINVGLPGDAVQKPVWKIFIPASAVPKYSIRDRDILIDDEGYRYHVSANEWTEAGYELSTVRLEA